MVKKISETIPNYTIYNSDIFEALKKMQEKNIQVDCIITSPPYWGLRDYGIEGQIGLEEHPQFYVDKIVSVFREAKKVLKSTGSLWLNLGDSYYSKSGSGRIYENLNENAPDGQVKDHRHNVRGKFNDEKWLQPKQRLLIPHRIAIAMQEDGWICRNDIIWQKPSHMPSSVQDRLTNSFEYVFHFVKQKRYYYDLDSIREPHKETSIARAGRAVSNQHKYSSVQNNPKNVRPNIKEFLNKPMHSLHLGRKNQGIGSISEYSFEQGDYLVKELHEHGKNPSDFWSLTSEPMKEAHFATFPLKLVRRPLLATCPKTGTVLDPFAGSGTTLLEAQNQGKNGIGIEINPTYVDLIVKRLNGDKNQQSLNSNKIKIIKSSKIRGE